MKVGQAVGKSCYGELDLATGSVIVFVDDEEEGPQQLVARVLNHELAHAYGGSHARFAVDEETPEKIKVSVVDRAQGAVKVVGKKNFGKLFEEWCAVERELVGLKTLDTFFPDETEPSRVILEKFVAMGLIDEAVVDYCFVTSLDPEAPDFDTSAYVAAHQTGTYLMNEVPGGRDSFRKARISQNWEDFSQRVDVRFGKGSYETILEVDPTDNKQCELLRQFLEMSEGDDREALRAVLSKAKTA